MKKFGLIAAGVFAALIFSYGSIASLVNQGLPLPVAAGVFIAVVVAGTLVVRMLGSDSDTTGKPDQKG